MPIITQIIHDIIPTPDTKYQNYTTPKLVEKLLFSENQEQENEIKKELIKRGELPPNTL